VHVQTTGECSFTVRFPGDSFLLAINELHPMCNFPRPNLPL